jgi:glucose/arabinose dehydrogenase
VKLALLVAGCITTFLAGCSYGTTTAATNITDSTAVLHGWVTGDKPSTTTTYWFDYGTTTAYGTRTPSAVVQAGDRKPHFVDASISGLTADTTYYVRLCARDTVGQTNPGCNSPQQFRTARAPPGPSFELTVSSASSITDSGATLNGRVNPDGAPASFWFEYGTSTAYGSSTPHRDAGSGTSSITAAEPVSSLRSNTIHHFRLCGSQAAATRCSPDMTFTTLAASASLPPGFRQTTVLSGLHAPTTARFSADGRIFVAEKSGIIKVFDGLGDASPKIFADLRTKVHNHWDRGLLGLELDPGFPDVPYVYVLYAHDAPIGGTAPLWGPAGAISDECPLVVGGIVGSECPVSGRLSRLRAEGDAMTGAEEVLTEGWCQQFPMHSVGSLVFGRDGALYASAGDGATAAVDYGQFGNACGDPPGAAGSSLSPPSAEGGSLRSQDLRTQGDPVGLNGTIIRVDPATGDGLPDNPLSGSSDDNARRIVAYGLRNPFRMTTRPGTDELWLGDVGAGGFEEIDRVPDPRDATVENFGWPCFEGPARHAAFENLGLDLCAGLYADQGAVTTPFFTYKRSDGVTPSDACPRGQAAISGLVFAFYGGGPYPPEYDGALFFADYTRNCIWVMQRSGGPLPHPSNIKTFVGGAAAPVDLQLGPGGDVFYVDIAAGTLRRVQYVSGNQAPHAVATASPSAGDPPLNVTFDSAGSSDPEGGGLTRAWDLDGDGAFDDSTAASATATFSSPGRYTAQVKVTDDQGASDTASATVAVGGPTARIAGPSAGTRWEAGDVIAFSGSATDPQDGALPADALTWTLTLQHCPDACHAHDLQSFEGVSSGSFRAPDHSYPAHLELRLTATDSDGLEDTHTLRLDPKTVELLLRSEPAGQALDVDGETGTAPFSRTVISGASTVLTAPAVSNGLTFASWSDGGARSHTVTTRADATYTAVYTASPP